LNITAIMGMTMIIGIEMAIFLVLEYIDLSREMPPRQALLEAARNRFRPIAMTTLAAILTLMPLALALGAGSGCNNRSPSRSSPACLRNFRWCC
jgi:multidrug efflux pump subunit AcrB